jgi:hypothetical protein
LGRLSLPPPESMSPRGEGRDSSRGFRSFLLARMGVWLEAEEAGRSSASTSSVMEDSWTSGPIRFMETAVPYTRNQ